MCSRFEQNIRTAEVARRFGLSHPPPRTDKEEIRPTDQALIIAAPRIARLSSFGLTASWSSRLVINARIETVSQKDTFRHHLQNRCIVPATAYMEWRKEGGRAFKNRISMANPDFFLMAALTSGSEFTILTCQPSPTIAHIHDRMPLILPPAAENDWLDPGIPFEVVKNSLSSYNISGLEFFESVPPTARQGDLFDQSN